MLQKIRGIVLKTTTYSESSVIVQVFTNKFGLQSYLINGVKKPKARIHINMLQPMHLLDMVAYQKGNGGVQRVSEARPMPAFRSIPYDIIKSTIIQFLNEVLYKSIRQQGADEQLFDFIYNSTCWFDELEKADVNFHLSFLMKLTRYLGFAPSITYREDHLYFDLQEGDFTSLTPLHPYFIEKDEAKILIALYTISFEHLGSLTISSIMRRNLLEKILLYYRLHTASFSDIRSHYILEEVLG
ncbi:MAG: DNA repair protein RecO [Pedobacter sp.]|nr:MAG: DNA repair protein RecO [Pedobacter sp.]